MNCHKTSCPAAFTDESEHVQGFGCLPSLWDIVQLRIKQNKTWECHSSPGKPCIGAIKYMKERQIECTVIEPLLTLKHDWEKLVNENKPN